MKKVCLRQYKIILIIIIWLALQNFKFYIKKGNIFVLFDLGEDITLDLRVVIVVFGTKVYLINYEEEKIILLVKNYSKKKIKIK